jgi:hypothetical protein
LPSSFQLDVPAAVLGGPVQIGDYLDEDDARPVAARRVAPPPPVRPSPPASAESPRVLRMPRTQSPIQAGPVESVSPAPQARPYGRPVSRKQLNMNPETLRMVEELLDTIQAYSVQKDAKASEMFHALVAALYEARDLLSLADVPPRGRWGTPTAHAFPVALKNAFQAAIAEWFRRHVG